jgi:hypothetical protein
MKTALSLFLVVVLVISAFAAAPSGFVRSERHSNPLDTQWGPDAFGYRAKDSNEAGGPAYQWFDLQANGTQVTDLVDDNIVGPIPIGFDFRYYWYDVSEFWIGSNGYLRFLGNGMIASPFYQFPYAAYQNVLGVWIGDWFYGPDDPSLCYYWSNGSDTLIVMWKNVRAWAQGGNLGDHDFEVILSGVDSSITYMYGQSTANDLYNNWQSRGFENVTGQLGLNFGFGTYPPNNYAIKIAYPDTVTYAVDDIGIAGVQNEHSAGFFLATNDTLYPWLAVRNTGNQTETSYTARYTIRNATNNVLVATDDTTMGTIAPSAVNDILFPALWTPPTPGVFRAVGRVTLPGDDFAGNDSVRAEVHVVSLPGELFYDDGASEQGWGWAGGEGGMANQFEPPVYPCQITSVRIYVTTTIPEGFTAQILDDDGTNGSPSTVLWEQAVPNPSGNAWATVEVDPPVIIESGAFYVAWQQQVEGIFFGVDTVSTVGFSHRAWEYTGGWAEFREAQSADHMIRATIDYAGNHAPVITSHTPATLDTAIQNQVYTFTVVATDADGDPLDYTWRLNGVVVGAAPSVNVTFTQLGANHLVAIVTDGIDADSVSWNTWVVLPNAADDPALLPTQFALHAAYPNPFNPVTSIAYDVARASQVRLQVFNLAGEVVGTLVDGPIQPGRYHVKWNAAGQSSGAYFVAFDAAGVHQVQKVLLLK